MIEKMKISMRGREYLVVITVETPRQPRPRLSSPGEQTGGVGVGRISCRSTIHPKSQLLPFPHLRTSFSDGVRTKRPAEEGRWRSGDAEREVWRRCRLMACRRGGDPPIEREMEMEMEMESESAVPIWGRGRGRRRFFM